MPLVHISMYVMPVGGKCLASDHNGLKHANRGSSLAGDAAWPASEPQAAAAAASCTAPESLGRRPQPPKGPAAGSTPHWPPLQVQRQGGDAYWEGKWSMGGGEMPPARTRVSRQGSSAGRPPCC
jgi:hypothetical protein